MIAFRALHHVNAAILAVAWVAGPTAFAGDPPPPTSLAEQVAVRARHAHDFLDLIASEDPAIRQTALQMALQDADPVIRGLAMCAYLRRFTALLPEVQLEPGSLVALEDVPRLAIMNMQWSEDGASFTGTYAGPCNNAPVRGQIAGGRLAIAYDGVCLRPALLNDILGGSGAKAGRLPPTPCQVTLAPNPQNTSLDGPLQCPGMAAAFTVRLPFGA